MKLPDLFRPEAFTSSLICSNTPGDGAGGDGGGDGGDGGDAEVDDKTRDLIIRTVNSAVSSQMGRKLPTAIEQGVTAAMVPLQESIQALTGAQGGGAPAKGGAGENPEIVELRREQKALKAKLADEKTARETQEKDAKSAKKRSKVQAALGKAGVAPLRMKGAMAEVMDNIQTGDDGQVFFRDQSKGYEEDLTLAEGMKRWGGTDVGKSYLSPKDVSGSGANKPGQSGGGRPGNAPTDPKVAKAQRILDARKRLRGEVAAMVGGGAGIPLTGQQGEE